MAYLGYRVKIGNTIVPNILIAKGTYQFTCADRVSGTWKDANGIEHSEVYNTKQRKVAFSLRERTLSEQNDVKGIFANYENVSVKVWDDTICDYVSINCKMSTPTFSSIGFDSDIRYQSTQITLTEY